MRELEPCEICHEEHDLAELIPFGDMLLCPDCLDSATVVCERCGARIWRDDNAGDNDIYLCQRCYDSHYTTCSHCERVIREDDAHYEDDDTPLCYDCYQERRSRYAIQAYGYKPTPIFYGESDRYFGLELEMDEGGESDDHARELMKITNSDGERVYIKYDGSLNDGFEVVSHPMSLEYHLNQMPWAEVLNKARAMDYKSHQARTCGLHIHVNRTAFGDTEEEQDTVIARILFFFEKHWEELLKFSRRTQRQVEQWANRYGYKDQPMEILDHAKKGFRGVRYTAVNLTNTATIEFRLFRGTLKYNSFAATLQLVNRICDCAVCLSNEELKQMSWTTFAAGCTQYPELIQYLKERRLYVNDPVETEAEV